ncbi:5-methylcytosine restriction system specificity protein McrC [Brevibacillus parabrevis]|uniref:5-methylcytosine restriction system specificity protein McrC n=1 Tax=Brevibacillus parabrevis TaxID=54914 RepID=UPI0023809D91|nr:hypothetical protein [Brevibacillus parabrevis]WDV94873.1 hypothetical protein PSE45_25070 [Brevibacillus parabrevis]
MDWNVREATTTDLRNFPIDLLPQSLPKQVKIIRNKGKVGVEVGNIVGLIPLENGNSIRISPKYQGINIVDMMLYIQGINNKHKDRQIGEQYSLGNGTPDIKLFINVFLQHLKVIEGHSLKFERTKEHIRSNYVKGSVNWSKTKINIKKRVKNPIDTKIQVQNYEIPENYLLAAAAKKALNYTTRFSPDWMLLNKWAESFGKVDLLSVLRLVDKRLVQDRISGARSYYKNAIISGKIILGYYGIELGDDIEGEALLVNTPDLYEEFVRVGCQTVLKEKGIFVTKSFSPPEFLFDNGSCEIIPDLVFYKGDSVIAVGDVKYKEPDSKDYYQLYTYIKKAGIKAGIIFSPCKKGESEPKIESRKSFDNITVYDVLIPTKGSEELEKTIRLINEKGIIPR